MTHIPRVYDARPSWQRAIAIMAIPLALSLAGCDSGAAKNEAATVLCLLARLMSKSLTTREPWFGETKRKAFGQVVNSASSTSH